jgi:predicted Fe-Mo cluster-binding NifX family protein
VTVCLTAQGRELASAMDPSFGRARFFLFVDENEHVIEAVENEPAAHGAGVQAAQIVSQHGAKVVVTGSIGPNAYGGLSAAGIETYIGATGTAREALASYREGQLTQAMSPTRGGHGGGRG